MNVHHDVLISVTFQFPGNQKINQQYFFLRWRAPACPYQLTQKICLGWITSTQSSEQIGLETSFTNIKFKPRFECTRDKLISSVQYSNATFQCLLDYIKGLFHLKKIILEYQKAWSVLSLHFAYKDGYRKLKLRQQPRPNLNSIPNSSR